MHLLDRNAFGGPVVYRIRVRGRLDDRWRCRLGGLEIRVLEGAAGQPPITELTGALPDQAALMGVLQHLYARNIPLLGVELVEAEGVGSK